MAEMIQVGKKSQINLPQSVQKELGITEGDFLEVQVRNAEIVLRLKKLSDKDQNWFWTERWQQGERAAEEDIRAGRVQRFSDPREATAFLKKQNKSLRVKNENSVEPDLVEKPVKEKKSPGRKRKAVVPGLSEKPVKQKKSTGAKKESR